MTATRTPSDEQQAAHQARREQRLRWSIGTSLIIRPLAVLIPVIVIPVFFRYLGAERYGLYETIASLTAWIALSNMGLSFGLVNRLMDCHVSEDHELARRYVSTLFVTMLGLAAIGGVIVSVAALVLDWPAFLNARGVIGEGELRWSIWLACVIPLVAMVMNTAPAIHMAHQEYYRQNMWDGLGKVTTILACLAVPFIGLGLPGAILAISAVPIAASALNSGDLWFRLKPWLRPSLRLFRLKYLRSLLQDGILLFFLQSSVMFMFQADRLVINTVRSPEEVAQYAVLNRVFMLAYGAYMLILGPLWPAYGEAIRRGDIAWCQRKLKLTLTLGVAGMALAGLVLAVGGDWIVRILVGNRVSCPPLGAVIGMTAGCCLRAWIESYSPLLNGARVLAPQAILLGITAVLSLVANVFLTKHFGITGTAWSYPLVAAVTVSWGYPWLLRRFLRSIRPESTQQPIPEHRSPS